MKTSRDMPNDAPRPTTEQISVAAFHLYVENGCREGHELEDWLRAEELLTQRLKTVAIIPIFEPEREAISRPVEIHYGILKRLPLPRDEKGPPIAGESGKNWVPSRSAFQRLPSRRDRSASVMPTA